LLPRLKKAVAVPVLPARPVRPIRQMHVLPSEEGEDLVKVTQASERRAYGDERRDEQGGLVGPSRLGAPCALKSWHANRRLRLDAGLNELSTLGVSAEAKQSARGSRTYVRKKLLQAARPDRKTGGQALTGRAWWPRTKRRLC
jgi:hypothetical protein